MERTWYLHECGGRVFVDEHETLDRLYGDCGTRVLCVESQDGFGNWHLLSELDASRPPQE